MPFRIHQQRIVIEGDIVDIEGALPKLDFIDYPLGIAMTATAGNLPGRAVIAPVGASLRG
jgi:hypothetical protein